MALLSPCFSMWSLGQLAKNHENPSWDFDYYIAFVGQLVGEFNINVSIYEHGMALHFLEPFMSFIIFNNFFIEILLIFISRSLTVLLSWCLFKVYISNFFCFWYLKCWYSLLNIINNFPELLSVLPPVIYHRFFQNFDLGHMSVDDTCFFFNFFFNP